jgi:hypothetical protein
MICQPTLRLLALQAIFHFNAGDFCLGVGEKSSLWALLIAVAILGAFLSALFTSQFIGLLPALGVSVALVVALTVILGMRQSRASDRL